MRRTLLSLLSPLLLLAAVSASCSDVGSEYSSHQCYFIFNGQYHTGSQLLAACSGYETYAIVTTRTLSGSAYAVITQLYGQESTTDNITTASETNYSHVLGLSNALIIGRSTLDQTLYAFDRQCPNCYEDTHLTQAPLQWGDNSYTVKCNKCSRTYNLSGGGVIASGTAGSSLMRYRCSFDGTILFVTNR